MKIIFRADDLGFSEAVNYGIRKAIVDGVITCTGLMPNMPYAAAGYALVKDTGVEVGQHTNICVGRPLTDSARIPSLVQPSGEFCTSREIRARKQDTIVLEEVELEIQAQLDRFRAITGRDPAYFEGHAVMSPNFFQGLKNVAARNGLLYCDPVDPQWSVEHGIQCSAFYRLDERGLYDVRKFVFEDEAGLRGKECSVLVFHPGWLDQYLLEHSSYTFIRPMETDFLCSQELKDWLAANYVERTTFARRAAEVKKNRKNAMLDSNLMSLLTLLSENDYLTAQTLAVKSGASSRTVQTRIGQLRAELEGHGATVESRQRHGYRLRVEDRNAYETWYNENRHSLASAVPNTVEDRFRFLLACFLDGEEYFKLDDLSEELYVSSKTLSAELRQVEFVLGQYNITLKRKPHYGVRAHGSEFDRRRCYMDYLVQSQNPLFADQRDQAEMLPRIGEVLLDMMIRQRIKFTEAAFQNIVIYLYVAFLRSGAGHLAAAKPGELAQVQAMPEYQAALMLADRLCQAGIEIAPEPAETMYIAIYIAGRRSLGEGYHPQSSPVVQENVNRLTTILLDCVQRVYNLNFRDNLNVRISLYNHIVTFNIRMKYGIQMENPILEEIKQNYPFAFAMAQRAMAEYEKFYSRPVPESETGYFAIILEMALESLKAQIEKKNILLVCMTGKASSRLLAFRFRNEFGVYIDRLDVCSMYEFERYDLSRVDYVFTTVPLQTATAVPIYQIGNFLDASDVPQVRRQLELGSVNFLKDYYRPDLFFPHVQGNTREEVIRQMCQLMGKVYPLPEGFCDSVLEREAMGGTDFGHLVAIPHPADNLVNENVVCVGILDKPVLWSVNKVQLVILVAIYDSTSAQTQKFYQLTTALITDEVRVKRIISRRQYLHFMKLFQE